MSLTTKQLEALSQAWNNEGVMPSYHRIQKERLKVDWPMLYQALKALDKP